MTRFRAGAKRVLLVAATGAGKTVLASHIIVRSVRGGRRVLFVAHRRELIDQCYRQLLACGMHPKHLGIIMAHDRRRQPRAPVQVASIDTLRHRAKPPADILIVDEAHRALAKSYRDLAAAYPHATHLGLTATPYRAGGKGLGDAYDALVVVASPKVLIAEKFLVEPIVYTVPDGELPDLTDVSVKGGDYDEKALAEAVDRQVLVGNIVENWKKRAGGVRTVAFAASLEHSRHIAERFRAAGVPAEHLDGETAADERAAILARLERGETRIVSNCGVLCEGWDQPSVKCCILARPTKSPGLYLQQAGRILRPWTDPASGIAPRAIILDHAGCAVEHGLPQDDRAFSLETAPKKSHRDATLRVPAARTCSRCCAVVAKDAPRCPGCGLALEPEQVRMAIPEEVDVELVEMSRASLDEKRAEWVRLCALAKDQGFKAGWAYHRYKEQFGVAPPRFFAFPKEAREYSLEEKRAYFEELEETARTRGYQVGYAFVRYRAKFGEAPPVNFSRAREERSEPRQMPLPLPTRSSSEVQ